jgi:hypothetical protein
MCFSAEASFAASAVLAASSVAISRLPKEKAGVPLSLFPAVFAAHQFIEGLIWLQQDGVLPDAYQPLAVYAYALIAYVLWPVFVPFSVYLLETGRRRRSAILCCQAIGLAVGLRLLLAILHDPVTVAADCYRLSYRVDAPALLTVPYVVAVAVPFLVSSHKSLALFGLAVTASCTAAAILATATTFPSVWCFFAALLSAGLYLHFRTTARTAAEPLRVSTSPAGR